MTAGRADDELTHTPDRTPVLRLRSPGEICQAVPYLVGFDPAASLVVVSLRGLRRRVGLVARVDLPSAGDPMVGVLAEQLADQLVRDRATGAALVAYAEPTDADPQPLVRAVLAGCETRGIEVVEALQVRGGRWTSFTCSERCCPASGTPLLDRLREPGAVVAAMTAEGRHVIASRDELERSVLPVVGLLAHAMHLRLHAAIDEFVDVMGGHAREPAHAYADQTVRLAAATAVRVAAGEPLGADVAARILAGLLDREVRNRCLPGSVASGDGERLGRAADPLALWLALVRRAVEPGTAAPVATLLAACAYLDHGDGALANVALARALDDEPGYVLALSLRTLLDHAVAPSAVREWLAEAG